MTGPISDRGSEATKRQLALELEYILDRGYLNEAIRFGSKNDLPIEQFHNKFIEVSDQLIAKYEETNQVQTFWSYLAYLTCANKFDKLESIQSELKSEMTRIKKEKYDYTSPKDYFKPDVKKNAIVISMLENGAPALFFSAAIRYLHFDSTDNSLVKKLYDLDDETLDILLKYTCAYQILFNKKNIVEDIFKNKKNTYEHTWRSVSALLPHISGFAGIRDAARAGERFDAAFFSTEELEDDLNYRLDRGNKFLEQGNDFDAYREYKWIILRGRNSIRDVMHEAKIRLDSIAKQAILDGDFKFAANVYDLLDASKSKAVREKLELIKK